MHEYGTPSSSSSDDFSGHPPEIANTASFPELFPATLPPPNITATATTPLLAGGKAVRNDYDSICEVLAEALGSDVGFSSYVPPGSGSNSVPSYYYAQRPSLIQRCMSSESLPNDGFNYPRHNPIFSSLLHQSESQNLDLDTLPMGMRKVFSTGDLQTINVAQQQQQDGHHHRSDSPLSHENFSIEGTNKVRCYSAEERKERIERYRSKRSQRNFNKKIKYACRKTLADSRPRIRGRFARNEEIGESFQTQWTQMGGEEDEEDDDIWTKFLNALSTNLIPIDP